jgi:integrase
VPQPAGLTAHKLRHTFASLLFAIGKDPVYVMQQLYAHMMRRSDEERARLEALVDGAEWAPLGR